MVPIAAAKVDAAEAKLRFRFPAGYRAFMARYGEAFYSNDLRIYGPDEVVRRNEESRLGEGEYFFWTDPASALGRERAPECVRYADTLNGDELAVHPAIEGASFLFPRDSETIHRFDGDLDETLEWVLTSAICLAPSRSRYVEPLVDVPGYRADWRVDDSPAGVERWLASYGKDLRPSFEEAVARVAALDAQSRILRDVVADMHRVEVFLPRYEARVRLEARDEVTPPELELIFFLDDERAQAEFRRALLGVEIQILG
jgi:hypothetical protein